MRNKAPCWRRGPTCTVRTALSLTWERLKAPRVLSKLCTGERGLPAHNGLQRGSLFLNGATFCVGIRNVPECASGTRVRKVDRRCGAGGPGQKVEELLVNPSREEEHVAMVVAPFREGVEGGEGFPEQDTFLGWNLLLLDIQHGLCLFISNTLELLN